MEALFLVGGGSRERQKSKKCPIGCRVRGRTSKTLSKGANRAEIEKKTQRRRKGKKSPRWSRKKRFPPGGLKVGSDEYNIKKKKKREQHWK